MKNSFDQAARKRYAGEADGPMVTTGSVLEVRFANDFERAEVVGVKAAKKAKSNRGDWIYKVRLGDTIRKTRLVHLEWRVEKTYMSLLSGKARIVAPMVGGSELAFRLLCRKYGANVAYTPMLSAESFVKESTYRKTWLQVHDDDRPLVAHFWANEPETMAAACELAVREFAVDAVDLNLGCPQRVAFSGHFGSYLLGDDDRELVKSVVRAARRAAPSRVAVCAKIRLLDSSADTIKLVEDLRDAGADVVAIHGRKRATWHKRGPGARDGPADLDAVAAVVDAVTGVKVVTNGNVRDAADVDAALEKTRAHGLMAAEGLLNDPSLFAGGAKTQRRRLELAAEYLDLCVEHGNPAGYRSVAFHVRRICAKALESYEALDALLDGSGIDDARRVVSDCLAYETGAKSFVADPNASKRAAQREKQRDAAKTNRRRFEERMARKAKREGKPLDFYLATGAEPPTSDEIDRYKAMSNDADRLNAWKLHHAQVCFKHFLAPGGCPRPETCAFIHPVAADDVDNLVSG